MSEPAVTIELDLTRVQRLRPDDPPLRVGLWPTVYVVQSDGEGGEIVTVILPHGELELKAVR